MERFQSNNSQPQLVDLLRLISQNCGDHPSSAYFKSIGKQMSYDPKKSEHATKSYWKVFTAGLSIGLIGCVATWYFCHQQFGPPSKVPDLAILIGHIAKVKHQSEGMVYTIKQRRQSHIITNLNSVEGASHYRDVSSSFNGILKSLETMLSTGSDERSIEAMRTSLGEAQKQHEQFVLWFNQLPRELHDAKEVSTQPTGKVIYGDLKDIAAPMFDLAKHFFDALNEMDKIKRDHLIEIIRETNFKQWQDIPGGVDAGQPAKKEGH